MKRLFGTDGIRGAAGAFPLDPATLGRVGEALALRLAAHAGRPARLVVGRDTRESSAAIEDALARGIARAGASLDRGGVLTTPAIACLTRLGGYDAGIVVSASHNPFRDNGVKVFSAGGTKLSDALEAEIERDVLDGQDESATLPAANPGAAAGAAGRPGVAASSASAATEKAAVARYLDWLTAAAGGEGALRGWTVVLDCAHGAASRIAPEAFRRLGADVIAIHDQPDGRNINADCGALHPEALQAEVVRRKARLGLAFDGDADRCLVVDGRGRLLDGDYVLFLAARDLLRSRTLRGNAVVGTVMSNMWLEDALRQDGLRLVRAPVGDKYVLEEMERIGCSLGGEPSGHVIFRDQATTGDGLLTGALFAGIVGRSGIDLEVWAASVRPYPQVLVNVKVRERPSLASHPRIGPAIRDEERKLGERGRLLVRYSGTEPQARIMVEGDSHDAVEGCAERLRAVIEEAIGLDPS